MVVKAYVALMQGGALASRRSHCTSHGPHRSTQEAAVRAPVCRGGRDTFPSRAPADTTLYRGADWATVDAPQRGPEANRAERYTTQRTCVRHRAGARCETVKIPEILQVETPHSAAALASVLNVIAEAGLALEHVSSVGREQARTLWEITVEIDTAARPGLVERLNALPTARFIAWSDRAFERHRGGKIEMRSRVVISTQQILRAIYTPGVARVCLAIRTAPERVFDFTYIGRAVAIVSDGSAVLGLGNIGPRAGLPVIEGKAALFSTLVGISGIPILIESAAVDHFVDVVCSIAPSFGAILLEDISAPRCFEIEQKLRSRLPIPVLHVDQHATAVVVLAALLNAIRETGATLETLTVGVVGLGAAGLGIARLLHAHGVKRLLGTDLRAEAMGRLAQLHGHRESLDRILGRADAVICTTGAKATHCARAHPRRADHLCIVRSRCRNRSRRSAGCGRSHRCRRQEHQ
jgi:malate dehydrogenase (oxaloacetate-decarboxylating)